MPEHNPLIAVISAVPAAIPPTATAFEELLPAATVWNILDDRLLADAGRHGGITAALSARMHRLITHAVSEDADAVLLTCSMYAPVAREVCATIRIPVLGPDDALFEAATQRGYRRLAVVSSAADPLADSLSRLRDVLDADTVLEGVIAPGAVDAARAGDVAALVDSVVTAVGDITNPVDAIVLSQFSLAPTARAVQRITDVPTLPGPEFAVRRLHTMLTWRSA
ncbi:hypothetical protein B1R94_19480 [Mycolicibacterium litorale]|nr:hypothetical protein B1R94_19480 [Mycolicibacterium litorale]